MGVELTIDLYNKTGVVWELTIADSDPSAQPGLGSSFSSGGHAAVCSRVCESGIMKPIKNKKAAG